MSGLEDPMPAKALTKKIQQTESPKEVFAIMKAHAGDLDEIHLSTCLYQIARLRRMLSPKEAQSQDLRDLVDYLDFQTSLMVPYTLANTAWSVAQLEPLMGKHALKLMPSIAEHSIATIGKFNPRHLSNLVLACATVKHQNPLLFQKVADGIGRQINTCNAQDLSNLVWGFAALGYADPALMEAVAVRAQSIIGTFPPQNLANLAWGFATFGITNEALMDAIEARAVSTIHMFDGQNIGNLAWSYWRLGLDKQALMSRLCDALCKLSVGGRTGKKVVMDWASVMPAAVNMGIVDKATLAVCAQSLLRPQVLRKANDYNIAALMRSAQLDGWEAKEPELFQALTSACEARRIGQAALESNLLKEPSKWLAAFR